MKMPFFRSSAIAKLEPSLFFTTDRTRHLRACNNSTIPPWSASANETAGSKLYFVSASVVRRTEADAACEETGGEGSRRASFKTKEEKFAVWRLLRRVGERGYHRWARGGGRGGIPIG